MKPGDLIKYKGHPALVHSIGQYECLDAFNEDTDQVRCTDEITIYIFDEDSAGHFTRVVKETRVYPVTLPDIWTTTHPGHRRLNCHPAVVTSNAPTANQGSSTPPSTTKESQEPATPCLPTQKESASTSVQPNASLPGPPGSEGS